MIVNDLSKDALILQNILSTLRQTKPSGQANVPLVIDHVATCGGDGLNTLSLEELETETLEELASIEIDGGAQCTVVFYTDEARTDLFFTQNTTDNASNFTVSKGRTLYTPPDSLMNNAGNISTTMAQPIYWVTVIFCDGTVKKTAYRNVDNLLFQNVLVTSKPDPKFATNDNCCIVYPKGQRIEIRQTNAPIDYIILDYVLYLQLNIFGWKDLSESDRVIRGYSFNNLIRNALQSDTSRGGYCTFFNKDLNETYVGNIDLRQSEAVLKGSLKVQCCYQGASNAATEF